MDQQLDVDSRAGCHPVGDAALEVVTQSFGVDNSTITSHDRDASPPNLIPKANFNGLAAMANR